MKSLKRYQLVCGCIARVKVDEASNQWVCEVPSCEAEVYPHQLTDWPKDKNGNDLPRPKDKAIRTLP